MLRVTNLSKSYDRSTYAVRELSFTVEDGRILALLGHNGAGKTTTLRIAAATMGPTSGEVTIDGTDIFRANTGQLRQIKRGIGLVTEASDLPGYLTAREYLHYVGQMYGMNDGGALDGRVDELVERFSITDASVKPIDEYSTGLKKRIGIASRLINSPRLLLLDEPTAHLDPIGVKMLKEYLKDLRLKGVSIILATHQLDVAEQLADEILIINEGQKVYNGTLDDLRLKYKDSDGGDNLENFYSKLIVN